MIPTYHAPTNTAAVDIIEADSAADHAETATNPLDMDRLEW